MNSSAIIKNLTLTELVKIFGDSPQKEGLHIYCSGENFEEIPLSYPYKKNNYGFIMVVKGELQIRLNLISYTIKKNELVSVKPLTTIQFVKTDENLEFIAVSFSVDFILKNAITMTELDAFDFFTANSIPKLQLSVSERELIVKLTMLLRENNLLESENGHFKQEIITSSFNLLLYHMAAIYKRKIPDLDSNISRKEKLTISFLKILNENFMQERNVQFYADILCVTANHLSKVLKEISGKTASQLISDAVILEAKILLRNPSLTISEVSNELKFSDQSFFGKYFKKSTGLSPNQFKNSLKE